MFRQSSRGQQKGRARPVSRGFSGVRNLSRLQLGELEPDRVAQRGFGAAAPQELPHRPAVRPDELSVPGKPGRALAAWIVAADPLDGRCEPRPPGQLVAGGLAIVSAFLRW